MAELSNKHESLVIDYKTALGSINGEGVLKDLSQFCFEHKTTTACPCEGLPIDSLQSAFNDGRRSVLLHIRKKLAKKLTEQKQETAIS